MIVRRSLAAIIAVAALAACGPNTPAEPNNLVGVAPSAEASPSDSPSPTASPTPPPAAIPTTDVVVPTPAVTTKQPAPVKTTTKPAAPKTTKPAPPPAVYYKNCDDVRAHGAAPLYRGQPGYRAGLDRDNDGVACE